MQLELFYKFQPTVAKAARSIDAEFLLIRTLLIFPLPLKINSEFSCFPDIFASILISRNEAKNA